MNINPTGVGSQGDVLSIQHFDGLNGTPAAELAVRGWCDLQDRGLGDGNLNMSSNLQAVVGYGANGRDMLPVGVITWLADDARVWVHQSYVIPEFRGRGIYSAMWTALVEHVTNKLPKVRSIESATHVRNVSMRAIAAKLGRREESVVLRFDIQR